MKVLGIESTAHTFGVGIIEDKKILANEMDSFSSEKGGMIPNEVAEHHMKVFDKVIKNALDKANLKLKDIELVAFSQGPGIGNSLKIGATAARSISLLYKKPIIGVNHCLAHLEIGNMMTNCKDPVLLYVSGANTQVIAYDGGKYRIFGETLDMGIGNFIDSFGRLIGIGFPAGKRIEEYAKKGRTYIKLPYVVKGMDVSFGGIFTNLRNLINNEKENKLSEEFISNICYSVQETVFAMMIEVAERAMAHCEKKELLLGGGVACNKRMQEMSEIMCRERRAESFALPNALNIDNGVMIAWLGHLMYDSGIRMSIKDTAILPYERTDQVKVGWR